MKSYCLPYLVNRSRIFHNCVSWYNWAVFGNLSQHEFEHVHYCSRERRVACGILSSSSAKPRNGVAFVFFSHHAPDIRKGAKFLSRAFLPSQVLSPIFNCIHCFYFRQTPLFRGAGSARHYSTYSVRAATTKSHWHWLPKTTRVIGKTWLRCDEVPTVVVVDRITLPPRQ